MKEIRIDCAHQSEAELALAKEQAQLVFRLNHTMPMTDEYDELLHRLFPDMGLNHFESLVDVSEKKGNPSEEGRSAVDARKAAPSSGALPAGPFPSPRTPFLSSATDARASGAGKAAVCSS